MPNTKPDVILTTVKSYITPILISILGIMLWGQLSELREDVKKLLAYQAANDVKVSILEKEIDNLREKYDSQSRHITGHVSFPERATAKKEEGPKIPTAEENNI
tara:strand:- start:166 stop:477 length:312 start_codon:yes stop_codon:yes gene_type:complete